MSLPTPGHGYQANCRPQKQLVVGWSPGDLPNLAAAHVKRLSKVGTSCLRYLKVSQRWSIAAVGMN